MIEGIATASTVNQNNAEVLQGKVDAPVETTPDVAEGKVNPVDDVENLSNKSTSDEQSDGYRSTSPDTAAEHIIDLLG
jgi:hypothetical protein